jgi:hypothetical protein
MAGPQSSSVVIYRLRLNYPGSPNAPKSETNPYFITAVKVIMNANWDTLETRGCQSEAS